MCEPYYLEDIGILIAESKDINFVACALMPLHVIGINAAIRYLNQNGIKLHGFIIVFEHSITGRHISKEDFIIGDNKITVCDGVMKWKYNKGIKFKALASIPSFHKRSTLTPFYYINSYPNTIIFNYISRMGYKTVWVQIDDGGASYVSRTRDAYELALLYIKDRNIIIRHIKIIIQVINGIFQDYCAKMLSNTGGRIDFRLFDETQKTQRANPTSIKFYKEAFKRAFHGNLDTLKCFEGCILINTQCLEECNLVDDEIDYRVYKAAISNIKDIGNNIVIKPHPRELNVDKYKALGVAVYDKYDCTQEVLLSCLEESPICVISIYSSTLMNISGIFDIPAISLAKIVLKEKPNPILKKVLEEYIEQYGNAVHFPESYDELTALIRRIKRERV